MKYLLVGIGGICTAIVALEILYGTLQLVKMYVDEYRQLSDSQTFSAVLAAMFWFLFIFISAIMFVSYVGGLVTGGGCG